MPRDAAARRGDERAGRLAESLCTWHLRLRGYAVLARRFRCPAGEIDIVARRGNTIAFLEIKLRRTLADALEAVGPRQRHRIAATAEVFLASRSGLSGFETRFDVMLVIPWRLPVHVANAWHI